MKIPIYERQVGLTAETPEGMGPMAPTGPLGSMEAAGLPAKVLGQTGAVLTQLGGEVLRHMRYAKQLNDLSNANYAAQAQLKALQNSVKEGDPEVQVKVFEQGAKNWFDNQYQNLADPEVQAAFKNHWTSWYFLTWQQVKNAAEKQKGFVYFGNLQANWQRSIDLGVKAADAPSRAKIKGEAFEMLNRGVDRKSVV